MTRRELLLESFDEHIINLRILARRFVEADRIEDLTAYLHPDWKVIPSWYDSLWPFELKGISVSGYPGILENASATEYATPKEFAAIVAGVMFLSMTRNRTAWGIWWRRLPDWAIERDPRYVAYRTMRDWVVLNAKVLADRGDAFDDQEVADGLVEEKPGQRKDPFELKLGPDAGPDGVPIGMSCGNPRERLVGGRQRNRRDEDFLTPGWHDVKRPWAAIRWFHYRGLLLPIELRDGALREHPDPRLLQLELLRPEVFAAFVSDVLCRDDADRSRAWRELPVEDVERDPRFVAHRCGFDSQMIVHIAREARANWEREVAVARSEDERRRAAENGEALHNYLKELGIEPPRPKVEEE